MTDDDLLGPGDDFERVLTTHGFVCWGPYKDRIIYVFRRGGKYRTLKIVAQRYVTEEGKTLRKVYTPGGKDPTAEELCAMYKLIGASDDESD